ncbi:hypothetical protein THRCLA_07421 [Thraustotheca clavata]|uniref:SUEL-type lectin domain-containing protein n=1 Tax=Thraustotheca clavata TaxID=74557 RepID=A0A1V9ZDQ7_9STRA|nr:hypothetical protein THRCLA_07421 [Thraustotheca clavata]
MGGNQSSPPPPPPPPPPPTAPPTPALYLTSGATLLTQTAGEGSTVTLDCGTPTLQISRVIFASYGLPDGSGLGARYGVCYAGNSYDVVRNACVGLRSCSVGANNGVFGDPCGGTVKRLTVTAECTAAPKYQTWATVADHQTMNLVCAPGYVIGSIDFASYGTPNGYSTGWCHAGQSWDIINKLCVGQQNCQVPAEAAIFSDPCVGTFKALASKVTCTQGSAPKTISTSYVAPSCNTS